MPTLQFKGKNIIWNHHLSIPYHTLGEEPELHFQPEKADGNLLIEGDNLLALKALLPMYAGKIKCIYIDPPYNIGNEGWVYNDKVNSPLIRDWLHKEVGKDDMTRHDKWLCMMTPRLKLLKELLTDDGVIFISIDDNAKYFDSFSGSGTTAHAVMDLNKEDGGNRKFILVQMTEATEKETDKNICKDITRVRIKRTIEKYGYDSGFKYHRVGQPLDAETLLEGNLPDYKVFAKYVYYLCTGENLKDDKKIKEKDYFIGTFGNQAIFLIYKQGYEALTKMVLNLNLAEKFIKKHPKKKRIVYAPACFLDQEYMEEKQIEFVSIPYNLFQRSST